MSEEKKYDELRRKLAIDENDLDSCLIEQSELLFHAAEQSALASAEEDAAKLELKELLAELGELFRRKALEKEERLTEKALEQALTRSPKVEVAERRVLESAKVAGKWGALKTGYLDRSKMLQSLVNWKLRQISDTTVGERGVRAARAALGDAAVERVKKLRRERRDAD